MNTNLQGLNYKAAKPLDMPVPHPFWHSPRLALVILTIVIVATGIAAYLRASNWVEDSIERELSSVARMKSNEIEQWLLERRMNVQVAVASPLFVDGMRKWLDGGQDPGMAAPLRAHLETVAAMARFSHVCLRSAADGAPMLTGHCHADTPLQREMAMRAARTNEPQMEDFHRNEEAPATLDIGIFSPVVLATGRPRELVAQVSMDAASSLFPRLQQWPGSSPSAEALLVRRDADDVLFLNKLRYRPDPPLSLRHPLSDNELLAGKAMRGSLGLVRGHDYRGVPSVGYVVPVAGTPWLLVAKMDQAEADAWLGRLTGAVFAATALVLLMAVWWWTERKREQDKAEAALALKARELAEAQRIALTGSWEWSLADKRVNCSSELRRLTGCGGQSCPCASDDNFLSLFTPRTVAEFEHAIGTAMAGGVFGELEMELQAAPGGRRWLLARAEARRDEAGGVVRLHGTMQDITERKRVREQLEKYAAEVEDLYQKAPCGYHSIDADGRIRRINDTELAWLGYRREDIAEGMLITDILSPASRQRFAETFPRMKELGYVRDLELDFVRRDGSILPALVNATAIHGPDGRFIMTRSTIIDMTARRAMEQERERQAAHLAALSRRLVSVQEDERRQLSAELHDRSSPNLAALDITLRTLTSHLPPTDDGEAVMLLADAAALLADTNDSIRQVCADLRPPVLDYAGLLPALQSYAQQYAGRTGLAVEMDCSGQPIRFDPHLESTLFRIAQEALTNCAKHAGAGHVCIGLGVGEEQVSMTIADDGTGFATDAVGAMSPGLGLLSMRERAEFVGGSFCIESSPGRGTRVTVNIPFSPGPPWVSERSRQSDPDPERAQALTAGIPG